MTDSIISVYGSGGYQTFLDAEAVTTTAGQLNALRQRIQISVRDITSGASTEVGDAANQAIRVSVIGTVTTTGGGGGSTPNVTVTSWIVSQPITISGTVTATGVTIQQATVTQGTTPWIVTYTQGMQAVTFTTAVVSFSGAQPVTQSNAPWLFAQLDEQGNRTQDSEIRTVLQEMLTELRSIRLGWEYLVASMEDAKTSVPSLREQAEEQQDEGVTN